MHMNHLDGLEFVLTSVLPLPEAVDVAEKLVPWVADRDLTLLNAVSALRKPLVREDGSLIEKDEDGMYVLTDEEAQSDFIQKQVDYNLAVSDAVFVLHSALYESLEYARWEAQS